MSLKAGKRLSPSLFDEDFKAALPALKRAAKKARETAIQTNTPLVIWQNGRVKTVKPIVDRKRK